MHGVELGFLFFAQSIERRHLIQETRLFLTQGDDVRLHPLLFDVQGIQLAGQVLALLDGLVTLAFGLHLGHFDRLGGARGRLALAHAGTVLAVDVEVVNLPARLQILKDVGLGDEVFGLVFGDAAMAQELQGHGVVVVAFLGQLGLGQDGAQAAELLVEFTDLLVLVEDDLEQVAGAGALFSLETAFQQGLLIRRELHGLGVGFYILGARGGQLLLLLLARLLDLLLSGLGLLGFLGQIFDLGVLLAAGQGDGHHGRSQEEADTGSEVEVVHGFSKKERWVAQSTFTVLLHCPSKSGFL